MLLIVNRYVRNIFDVLLRKYDEMKLRLSEWMLDRDAPVCFLHRNRNCHRRSLDPGGSEQSCEVVESVARVAAGQREEGPRLRIREKVAAYCDPSEQRQRGKKQSRSDHVRTVTPNLLYQRVCLITRCGCFRNQIISPTANPDHSRFHKCSRGGVSLAASHYALPIVGQALSTLGYDDCLTQFLICAYARPIVRRRIKASPTSAMPMSVSDAGSGT